MSSIIVRGLDPSVKRRVAAQAKEHGRSVEAEVLAGVQRLPDSKRKTQLEAAVNAAVEPYRHTKSILTFDSDAATEYANVIAGRQREGHLAGMADAQISAICRVHGTTCATRSTKDFTATGIESVNPWTA